MSHVFNMMEARPRLCCSGLFEDPGSPSPSVPWRVLRHVLPGRRVPGCRWRLLRALFRPAAALRGWSVAARFRAALVVPAGSTAVQRLDHVENILGRSSSGHPECPAAPALGFSLLAAAGRLTGRSAGPGSLQPVLWLPHNVTTEIDLALSHSPRTSVRTRRRPQCSTRRVAGSGPPVPRPRASPRPAVRPCRVLRVTGTGPSQKSIWGLPTRPTIRPTSSGSSPTIPLDDPGRPPTGGSATRPGRRKARWNGLPRPRGADHAAGHARPGGPEASPALRRPTRAAEVPHRRGPRRRAGAVAAGAGGPRRRGPHPRGR